jgi:hypothetical protein
MGARLGTLDAIEAALWRELLAAPRDRAHPWRTPVLATSDGDVGDARTVVVREIERESATLLIYTDRRAPKVAQATRRPLGTLVMWWPGTVVTLGSAQAHAGGTRLPVRAGAGQRARRRAGRARRACALRAARGEGAVDRLARTA